VYESGEMGYGFLNGLQIFIGNMLIKSEKAVPRGENGPFPNTK